MSNIAATTLHVITDFRFWIFLLFIVRLENINLPPYDEHNWRQTVTLGAARSYLEVDANFFYPRTVVCDSREGYFPQEFPLFNYLVYLLWSLFSAHNWVPRLLNLIVSSWGLWAFGKLAARWMGRTGTAFATVAFGVSVAFMYARKAMPDTFSVSLVLLGIYWLYQYLDTHRRGYLIGYTLGVALGLLCKMPATVILAFALPVLYEKPFERRKLAVYGLGVLAVACMVGWYFGWVPYLQKFGFSLFFPVSYTEGLRQLIAAQPGTTERFYPIALTSIVSFWVFAVGLLTCIWDKNWRLLGVFGASVVLIAQLMLRSGDTFSGHVYYIIPFVPAMALMGGYAVHRWVKSPWIAVALLALVTIEGIQKHRYDFFIPYQDQRFVGLEAIVDKYVPKHSLIMVNTVTMNPVMMYAAHRRGWATPDRYKDTAWVNSESNVGLHYLVFERSTFKDSMPYPMLYQDNEIEIYKVVK